MHWVKEWEKTLFQQQRLEVQIDDGNTIKKFCMCCWDIYYKYIALFHPTIGCYLFCIHCCYKKKHQKWLYWGEFDKQKCFKKFGRLYICHMKIKFYYHDQISICSKAKKTIEFNLKHKKQK